jgi:hypothetical protein
MDPSTHTASPVPRTNGAPTKAKAARPVKYPHYVKVNLNESMMTSLNRICRRLGIPDGIGARIAITQFLSAQDPQYRGE